MAKIPMCSHPHCNNRGTHKIEVFRRGGRNAYLCDTHYYENASYYFENSDFQGIEKKNGKTISVEFETSRSTKKARMEFVASGYVPTHDSTVSCEYKSPIMYGLNSLAKHSVTFERLISEGELEVNRTCGTHLNVGDTEYINAQSINYISRFIHSLFVPLSEYLESHPQECKAVFGRELNHWASPIRTHTDAHDHCNFINLQHNTHIEFRICKFVNAKQYANAAKLCVAMVDCIIENFVKHFNDTPNDTRRYPTKTAYRKHKANVTAQKLVKLFQKFANN